MKQRELEHAEARRLIEVLDNHMAALKLPTAWNYDGRLTPWCATWRRGDGIVLLEPEAHNGVDWWHLSMSRAKQLPSWGELTRAKELWLGPKAHAVQVLSNDDEHINIHPFCLHLWARVDGARCLPDFRHVDGGV
jgi:hypothetical protein